MKTLFLVIVALALAGGFIAWLADRLGSYLGKKRVTIFHLRPRHTANLLTVVAGVVIAMVTLVVLVLVDDNFKTALIKGHALISENTSLQKNITGKQREVGQLQNRAQEVESKLAQMQPKLEKTSADLMREQNTLSLTQNELKSTSAKLLAATQMVAEIEKQGKALAARNQILAQRNNGLEHVNAHLATEVESFEGHPIVFHRNEELGRMEFATSQTPDQIGAQLRRFMGSLSHYAAGSGLAIGSNGRAVTLAKVEANGLLFQAKAKGLRPIGIVGQDFLPENVGENLELKLLAGTIASERHVIPSVVVVAKTDYNTFHGEQARIDLIPYSNKLVFSRGALIASGVVDGAQSENGVLASLQVFLVRQVRPVALESGIIPTVDPITHEESVGQPIESAKWLDLVKQIREIGGDVKITAVASEDTYCKGPLRLTLTAAPARNQRTAPSS